MKKRDKKQLLPGIVLSVAVGFLVFLYAPIDLYCSNADEFWFDFGILFTAALGLFAVCVAVMSLAYIVLWLIHPVAYRIGLAGGFIALICTYVQGNFMVKNLPPLDGSTIDWGNYTALRTEGIILWTVVAVITAAMCIFLKKELFTKAVMYLSTCLTLMLLVTAVSVTLTSGVLQEKAHYQIGADKEFVMSDDQNFVILLLDTVDARRF